MGRTVPNPRGSRAIPRFSWYLEGRADAHKMDAARLREAMAPTVFNGPPKHLTSFITAYETLLDMMHAISQPAPDTPTEPS